MEGGSLNGTLRGRHLFYEAHFPYSFPSAIIEYSTVCGHCDAGDHLLHLFKLSSVSRVRKLIVLDTLVLIDSDITHNDAYNE